MGDFNAVEEKCDRSTRIERNEASIVNKALIDLTNGLKLHDLWRKLKGNEKGHTFFHPKGSTRIDKFYADEILVNRSKDFQIRHVNFSDHCLISVKMTSETPTIAADKSHSFWKMNVSMLEDEEFKNRFSKFWQHACRHPKREECITEWWEKKF